jgi:hypothetical protein
LGEKKLFLTILKLKTIFLINECQIYSSVYNSYFNGLMGPTCFKIIYISVSVFDTCGFHKNLFSLTEILGNGLLAMIYKEVT